MAEVGECRAKFIAETEEWESGVDRVKVTMADTKDAVDDDILAICAAIEKGNSSFGSFSQAAENEMAKVRQQSLQTLDELSKLQVKSRQFKETFASFGSSAGTLSSGLSALAVPLQVFAGDLEQARSRSKAILRQMTATFGEEGQKFRKIAEEQLTIGLDPQKAASALQTLNRFGQASAVNLKLIEDAAAKTGRSYESLASKQGKAFQDLENAAPTAGRSVQAFQKEIGASSLALQKLGAKLDENNKVLADTPARAKAAENALRQYMQANFAGAAEKSTSATAKFNGELELLKREVAEGAAGMKEKWAPVMQGMVHSLRQFSPEAKAMMGSMAQIATTSVTVGAATLQAASQIALLATNTRVCAVATNLYTAALGACSLATLGVVAASATMFAAVGAGLYLIYATTEAIKGQTQAEEELLALEEKRARNLKKNINLIGKSAEEIRKLGKDSKDVAGAIDGLRDQAEAAKKAGNDALYKQIVDKIAEARKVQAELAKGDTAKKDADTKAGLDELSPKEQKKADAAHRKQEKEEAREREKERKEEVAQALAAINQQAAARKITHQEQIDQLKDLQRQYNLSAGEQRRVNAEIARLEGQDLKVKEAAEARALKGKIAAEVAAIKELAATKEIDKAEEIKRLEEILTKYKLDGAEKIRIEQEIAHLKGSLETEHTHLVAKEAAARKKALEATRKNDLKDAIAAIEEEAAARRITVQEEIDGLRKIKAEKAKTSDEKRSIDRKVGTLEGKLKSGELRDEKQDQKDQDEITRLNKGKVDAQKKAIDSDVQSAQDSHKETGADTTARIAELLKAKLALDIQEIEADKKNVQAKTKNAEVIKAAEEEAQAKIREAHVETTRKIKEENDKQHAIKNKKDPAFASGTFGLEGLAAQQSAIFGDKVVNDRIQQIRGGSDSGPGLAGLSGLSVQPQKTTVASPSAVGAAAGKAVADAVKDSLSITIEVNMPDGSKQSQSFQGAQSDLSKAKNIFSPSFGGF